MDRRKFIRGAGGIILSSHASGVLGEVIGSAPDYSCRSTERLTQGPYLTPNSPARSDIREGSLGIPLRLKFTVIDSIDCAPAADCVVDVWHCDALGLYSGVRNIVFDAATLASTDDEPVDMTDRTYLRGHQVTDENGRVEFLTVFPGWYLPRLAHIHVRTIWRDVSYTALDTQLYLPTDVEQAVYRTEPYAARGSNPVDVARDIVMKGDLKTTRQLTIPLRKDGDGYAGEYTIAAPSG